MKFRTGRPARAVTPTRTLCGAVVCLSVVAAGVSVTSSGASAADAIDGRASADASAVVAWNATASAALSADAALPAPTMAVGMAYVQAAVYNAVVGIEGRYALYKWNARGPRGASAEAAVAAAAHRVLDNYFPVGQPRVDQAYADALAGIPDGWSKSAGVDFGEQAANHLLIQRVGDGWQAPITYDQPATPGNWRPTPPGLVPYLGPWLGEMKPFMLRSSDQFRPAGPPALTSRRYTRDFQEVAALGSATSATRTAEQTEIARFFGGNLTVQLQGAYRDHVTRHDLDIAAAARYFAVADLTAADAVITAWDSKFFFHNWRPVTAIQLADTDGNPETTADPTWTPLIVTPPFPDYLSGHTTVIGAVTAALLRIDGTSRVDLDLTSTVTGTTRHYEQAATLNAEGIGARIWGGIHFRTADEKGSQVGMTLGSWASARFFR
jgi:PAP2 superfamily